MTNKYKCEHEKVKLGDNYCSVCGFKFDKKFSAQDLLSKFKILDNEMTTHITNIEVHEIICGRERLRGATEIDNLYRKWKKENFGI